MKKENGLLRIASGVNLSERENESLPAGSALSLATIDRLAKEIWEDAEDTRIVGKAKEIGKITHELLSEYERQTVV